MWCTLALVLICGALLAPASASGAGAEERKGRPDLPKASVPKETVTVRGYFSCEIPPGWSQGWNQLDDGSSMEKRNVHGVTFSKHEGGDAPVVISAFFHAAGNRLHASPDHFIAEKRRPAFDQADSTFGEVFDTVVAGRPARQFTRLNRLFVSAEPLLATQPEDGEDDPRVYELREKMARKVSLIERHIVIPAETGFHALCYSAPEERFEEFLDIFEQVVASFRPLR